MTKHRPMTVGHDGNHFIPRDFLRDRCGGYEVAPKSVRGRTLAYTANYRGYGVTLIDMSPYGGILPDWHIEVNEQAKWIEIKEPEAFRKPDHNLQPGEKWLQRNSQIEFRVIVTDKDFQNLLDEMTEEA